MDSSNEQALPYLITFSISYIVSLYRPVQKLPARMDLIKTGSAKNAGHTFQLNDK